MVDPHVRIPRRPETEQEEDVLMASVREHASALLLACRDLGWGGTPLSAAHAAVDGAADRLGLIDPPKPSTPKRQRSGAELSRRIWDRDGWTCQDCGGHTDLTVDHIVPVTTGGDDSDDNLQTLCHTCNARKGTRQP